MRVYGKQRKIAQQLPLFEGMIPREKPKTIGSGPALSSEYLSKILRFVAFHRAVTVAQVHREFFAQEGKRRQYCAHLLHACQQRGLLEGRQVRTGRTGRPPVAYQITAEGMRTFGGTPNEKTLKRVSASELIARLQLTEVVQVRADEGWRPVSADQAYRYLKRWAIRTQAAKFVDRRALEPIERMPDDTRMSHNILIKDVKDGSPGEVRILLQPGEHRNLVTYIKRLPAFYAFPPLTFELVLAHGNQLRSVRRVLDRLARKRKFLFEVEVVPPFFERPLVDNLSRERLREIARKPAGWEIWLR